ncbi:P-loop containing nucleoside triphosphate hydrolase protein [Limtongia smithiae]|uniref:P-loop containing nucleoside triphosphate hydrolase protein n=1 Tax=Limtongia smithiae TaxID=1125753 RepID=UPI0034CF1466
MAKRHRGSFEKAQRTEAVTSTTYSGQLYTYGKYYVRFLSYVWPVHNRKLQINIFLCVLLMLLKRAINVALPDRLGRITRALISEAAGSGSIPWFEIVVYLALRYLHEGGSIITYLENRLWNSIVHFSDAQLSMTSLNQALSLDIDYYVKEGASKIQSRLDCSRAISAYVENVTFEFLPLILDTVFAIGYFMRTFDKYFAAVVVCAVSAYMWASTALSQDRRLRKFKHHEAQMKVYEIRHDIVSSYETVKYFNTKEYETERFRLALDERYETQLEFEAANCRLRLSQNMIFSVLIFFSCVYAASSVATGKKDIGYFVTVLTYLEQIRYPLDYLTRFMKSLDDHLTRADKIIVLLENKPSVTNRPDAVPLKVANGELQFDNVSFSYKASDDDAIRDFCLNCPAGATVAFVGESGGGKSTLFRLLLRFYDVASGSIKIDGQDIRSVTLESLSASIGIVPQECQLFNDTIMYNIRYGRLDATDEEVYAAAKAASIHDKILRFSSGYKTLVGQGGLRLSGGERQRVAIARAVLKNPKILLLDEATAMLDVESEQNVHEALHEISQKRTTLIIAHRMSTILSADKIVVMHAGRLIEQGTHEQLLMLRGRYYELWRKQVTSQLAKKRGINGYDENTAVDKLIGMIVAKDLDLSIS